MKYAVKRYGQNPYGANPNWVSGRRVLLDGQAAGPDEDEMTSSEYRAIWHEQKNDYEIWLSGLSTPISQLDQKWSGSFTDYKQAREHMKGLITAEGGWESLTYTEKEIATRWFNCTPTQMMDFFMQEQGLSTSEAVDRKIRYSGDFNLQSVIARRNRYNAVYVYVRNVISRDNLEAIAMDLSNFQFQSSYIDFGREGTMKVNYEGIADVVGLFDYLIGTQGWSDFLASKGITPIFSFKDRLSEPSYGLTAQSIADRCMDILDNGNY